MSKAAFVVCPRQQRENRFDLAVVAERKTAKLTYSPVR